MAMRRCNAEEHHYDDSMFSSCPHCRSTVPYIPPPPEDDGKAAETVVKPKGLGKTVLYSVENAEGPAVGWLVVLKGPMDSSGRNNKGRDLRLVPGMNRLGRSADMEVCLDFGDNKIGRETHCSITFDPESNRYFLMSGEGRNLTHLFMTSEVEGEKGMWDVVLQPKELAYLDKIRVGDTVLMFIPLCTDKFKWDFD